MTRARIDHGQVMGKISGLLESGNATEIKGKKYLTVVQRNNLFRENYGLSLGIVTELLHSDEKSVCMVASIKDLDGNVIGTGHAEEFRGFGNINRTSAIENCETSAIGRALANIGLSGSEYASANELEGVKNKEEALESQAKNAEKLVRFAKQACEEIHAMTTVGQIHIWATKNEKKLETLATSNEALLLMVTNALDDKNKELTEQEMPVAETHGQEPDPTPAPAPLNSDEEIPF